MWWASVKPGEEGGVWDWAEGRAGVWLTAAPSSGSSTRSWPAYAMARSASGPAGWRGRFRAFILGLLKWWPSFWCPSPRPGDCRVVLGGTYGGCPMSPEKAFPVLKSLFPILTTGAGVP